MGVPHGSNLGLLLVYINDLAVGLKWSVKRLADDTSLLPFTKVSNAAANDTSYLIMIHIKEDVELTFS